MEHFYAEGEELISASKQALNFTERSLENMEDNFKLAAVLVGEVDQSERQNFERQLSDLRSKQSALEDEFSEKALEKNILREEIMNYNRTIEGYLNKLKDKEQGLISMKKINQEDNEMNINYEKEIKELEKKILQKKLENENLYQIIQNSKPELEQMSLQHSKYMQGEEEMNTKLDALQERIRHKELELQRQEISFRQFNENMRNRSVSPTRSPRRGLDSPLRFQQREPEVQQSFDEETVIKRRPVEEVVLPSEQRDSRSLGYVIVFLIVVIIVLLLKKMVIPQDISSIFGF